MSYQDVEQGETKNEGKVVYIEPLGRFKTFSKKPSSFEVFPEMIFGNIKRLNKITAIKE
ncbi:MAG: hypothetical protein ACE5HW_07040 [Candidatus Methanofastidiosia archaeon]